MGTRRLDQPLGGAPGGMEASGAVMSENEIVAIINKREAARAARNWPEADRMREQLRAKGVEVFDKTHEWRASDGRHGVIISGGSSGQAVGACELSDTEIIIKIEEREKARAAKDFTTSDRKRDELRAAGVDVFDKQRLWKTNDGRQGRIGVSAAAHLHAGKAPLTEFDIEQQLVLRERARAQKDWPTADRIREELRARGIELYDSQSLWKASDGRVGMLPAQQPGNPRFGAMGGGGAGMGMLMGTGAGVGAGLQGQGQGPASPMSSRDPQAAGGLLSNEAIHRLIEEREQARRAKDWATADKIRAGMRERGVEIFDKSGQWRTSDGRSGTVRLQRCLSSQIRILTRTVGVAQLAGGPPGGRGVGQMGSSAAAKISVAGGGMSDAEIIAALNEREVHRASKNWSATHSVHLRKCLVL